MAAASSNVPLPAPAPVRTPAWRYALGMFGTSIPINLIRGSIVLLYVDILGMDVRAYAAVMAVYAVIDAIDNPVLGHPRTAPAPGSADAAPGSCSARPCSPPR